MTVLRPATPDDIGAIAAIYAHHVDHGFGSFEEIPPGEAEMARRFRAITEAGFPYLVAAAADGRILGYAYAGPYRPRSAYRHTVEDSVYVLPDAVGQGVGRALLARLIEEARARGYRQMIAVIGDSGNTASIALHRAHGFSHQGVLRHVGLKKGRWLDSVLMQLSL
ncbi:GNAT family N-acetyltransferase [Zavarzinia aquatilis]|uniref:GNAT family N-acetyltransferase n=1 Tax=Zavarzinia aquatilis TaxID=2211142 RepID=UPI001FAF7927|nr:GNAT family N-acetyltransferase [Zavarzinia aquatilis]